MHDAVFDAFAPELLSFTSNWANRRLNPTMSESETPGDGRPPARLRLIDGQRLLDEHRFPARNASQTRSACELWRVRINTTSMLVR
jgi:hypothetical protein